MKPWHLGVMFAAIVLIATGSVAGVVLYVTQREDDRQAEIARDLVDANEALLRSQIEACDRGNLLRERMQTLTSVTSRFIEAARKARATSAAQATDPRQAAIDAAAASTYAALKGELRAIAQVRCAKVIAIEPVGRR